MASAHSANTGVKKETRFLVYNSLVRPQKMLFVLAQPTQILKTGKVFYCTKYTDPKFEILEKKMEKNGFYFCVPQLQNFDVLNVK